jgi:hypothetical protein
VYSVVSAIDYVRRRQIWQILKPQTGGLCLAMSKLPWLNDLIWFSVQARHDADGVLKRYSLNRGIGQSHEESSRHGLPSICALFRPPPSTAHR